ncbi:GNAT family N-acetyltransferase [Schumannella soli]|uniref:GNAT family N-acetyltransferase n=1 Tax=Schumannella soli TaxID=2590779 RepID=A0A506XSU4_9MICO|nr:GNAT family N-acetyltransferase [Schumannella soli]TPW75741.1 GNAT family N-acetyltransferase [Schumannella soli]
MAEVLTPHTRRATAEDVPRLLALEPADGTRFIDADRLRGDLDAGGLRLDSIWIAELGGSIVGRALWWGPPGEPHPVALDEIWVAPDAGLDAEQVGIALLEAGHAALRAVGVERMPGFDIEAPADWREHADLAAAVGWRERVAERAGLGQRLERVKLLWQQGAPVPPASARVEFRAASDEDVIGVLTRVARGSLDATTHREIAAVGAEQHARDEFDFYAGLPGRRDDWRLAFDRAAGAGGSVDEDADAGSVEDAIGVIIPSRSAYSASVSYLGVVPEARGRGIGLDLLDEITRVHAAAGEPEITALTDADNVPMRRTFARGGYRETGVRIVREAAHPLTG